MHTKLPRSGKSRRIAFKYYKPICVWCGVSISDLLEVAHIDHNRSNDDPKNLVFLFNLAVLYYQSGILWLAKN